MSRPAQKSPAAAILIALTFILSLILTPAAQAQRDVEAIKAKMIAEMTATYEKGKTLVEKGRKSDNEELIEKGEKLIERAGAMRRRLQQLIEHTNAGGDDERRRERGEGNRRERAARREREAEERKGEAAVKATINRSERRIKELLGHAEELAADGQHEKAAESKKKAVGIKRELGAYLERLQGKKGQSSKRRRTKKKESKGNQFEALIGHMKRTAHAFEELGREEEAKRMVGWIERIIAGNKRGDQGQRRERTRERTRERGQRRERQKDDAPTTKQLAQRLKRMAHMLELLQEQLNAMDKNRRERGDRREREERRGPGRGNRRRDR